MEVFWISLLAGIEALLLIGSDFSLITIIVPQTFATSGGISYPS